MRRLDRISALLAVAGSLGVALLCLTAVAFGEPDDIPAWLLWLGGVLTVVGFTGNFAIDWRLRKLSKWVLVVWLAILAAVAVVVIVL